MAAWLCYLEIVNCALYALLIIVIGFSKDKAFNSTYFKLFIVNGIYGVCTVLGYTLSTGEVPFFANRSFLLRGMNQMGSVGHTIGMIYVVFNRYRLVDPQISSDINWRKPNLVALIILQLVAAIMSAATYYLIGIRTLLISTDLFKFADADLHPTIIRSFSIVFYVVYIVAGIMLIYRGTKQHHLLQQTSTQPAVIQQQRLIVIHTILSAIVHMLKMVQQIVFLAFNRSLPWMEQIHSAYPIINDLSVFVPALLLVICSKAARESFRQLLPFSGIKMAASKPVNQSVNT